MKSPLVSVVIDTFNYGQYVEDAVQSVLAQDFPRDEMEILVVDDGSTDDTAARLGKYGDTILYLRKPNGGQASAFNFGFQHARGEIVALLDADDVWLENKLRRVCEAFDEQPQAQMVYHRTYLWRGTGETSADPFFVPVSGYVPADHADLLRYPMIATSSLAFRNRALRELLPVPESLRSQADAYLTALVVFVAPIVAIPEYLGKYRLHGANAFSTGDGPVIPAQVERRMTARAALEVEVRHWLERRGYDTRSWNLASYLKQWKKAQEKDSFSLHPPNRWSYFRHLIEFPWLYREIMSVRHRAYCYVRAFASLVLGYHHLHVFDDFRMACKRLITTTAAGARNILQSATRRRVPQTLSERRAEGPSQPAAVRAPSH